MRYSTHILTSIIVFSTAAAANAQGYGSFYAPAQPHYGVTQTNYKYVQPIRSPAPCLNGNCSLTTRPTQYPYSYGANYGLSQACPNGQCNFPQRPYGLNSSTYCPNGNCGLNCCRNGFCTTGQCLTGQCPNCNQPVNNLYGNSTIPFHNSYPRNYGATQPLGSPIQMNVSTVPNNSTTTIPSFGNQTYRPSNNSPYYN